MNELEYKKRAFCHYVKIWAQRFGLPLSEALCAKLCEHYGLLLHWNKRINLTRILDPEEAARFHYVESLYGERWLDPSITKIVDVGSGGGFPGIPVALARPAIAMVLIEKDRKRAVFLSEAVRRLGLENVEIFCGRFEAYGSRDFDGVICRALERMRERIPDLLAFAEESMQVLLFGDEDLERIVGESAASRWGVSSVIIPYTRERRLIILRQPRRFHVEPVT
ncbi:Ribosomal RNA small subunit methyltransferase G [bacterium HR08]|nr:Ribosomal RNA small subunit methyltransferase G [bacterium HR08]